MKHIQANKLCAVFKAGPGVLHQAPAPEEEGAGKRTDHACVVLLADQLILFILLKALKFSLKSGGKKLTGRAKRIPLMWT